MKTLNCMLLVAAALSVPADVPAQAVRDGEWGTGNGENIPRAKRVAEGDALAGVGAVSVCLRQTAGGPRIFVDGKAVRPRFFYGSPTCLCNISTTRKTVLKIPFAADRDTAHGRIALDGYPGVDPIWYSDAKLVDLTAGTTNVVQTAEEETNTLHYVADGLAFRKGHRYHYVFTHRATRPRTYFTIEVSYSEDGRKTKLPYYYGDTLGETVAIAAEAGVDFVTFSTDSSWGCEGWWNPPEEPEDYSKIDSEFARLLKINPRAMLVPRIMTDAPAWMHERHPEMRMVYKPHCSLNMSSVSYRPYRKAACEAVEKLSRHLREKFPRNYAGLQISGQNSAEWFYMLSQMEYFSGFDVATRAAFREWLKDRGDSGWATAEVPTPEERKSVNPSPRTVEFARFRNREMASFLVELGAAAKRGSGGNALTFFFYGYSWELGGPPAPETGHFDFGWLMKNAHGKIDGFSSPLSYSSRNLTGSTVMMSAAESVMRNGYLWFNEIDHRTHHEEMWDHMALFTPYSDPNVTREVMMRDSAADILRGYGDWWMDLFGRGWYRDADIWNVRRGLNALDDLLADRKGMYAPQIASVVHEDSFFRGGRDRRRWGLMKRTGFATCGADYGQYLLADVLENPPQSVKLFYLTIANDLAPDVRAKLNALKAARPDATFVENVTPQDVTAQAIAERARKAGVHCFTAPGAANVCSAEGFLLVQALQEGPLEIDFGRRCTVVDAIGGGCVCNGPKATLPFRLGETRIFKMSEGAVPKIIELTNGNETCRVDTCGARVLSYAVGGTELLWDMDARLSERMPWRHGGIPLAWPWFGRLGNGDDDIHGYSWKSQFEIKSQCRDAVVLKLETGCLRLEYSIALSDGLRLAMRTTCTSEFPQPVAMAFHPYFRVGERDMAVVEGVYDWPVSCTNAVDSGTRFGEVRPTKEYLLRDRARQLAVRIAATGSTGVNLWNPGAEKNCPGVIEGDEWRRFVAVEPYAMGGNRFMVLSPGQAHELGMTVSLLPSK